MPGSYETARNVLSTIGSINRYGRPDDFVVWRKGRSEAMTPASVQAVATADFHPESMTWIVVGDRSKIEEGVRKLGIGEVTVIDVRPAAEFEAGHVEDVLDRDRYARQCARVFALIDVAGKLICPRSRGLISQGRKGIEPRLQRVRAFQGVTHGRARITLPAAVLAREGYRIRQGCRH